VLTPAPVARLLAILAQRFGFSLPAVFIASSQRSLLVPKPAKQNVVKLATWFYPGLVAHSFFWSSELA
jgi:hypothetical protein